MNDPVGTYGRIRDSYVRYVKTAFGTNQPELEKSRERLLRSAGTVSQEPWIEPLPRYESSGVKIATLGAADLPGMSDESVAAFKGLVAAGLFGEHDLHRHQLEMLQTAVSGRNCVVTAGTGSGKTESFLLPLFAYLANESRMWAIPNAKVAHQDDWWANEDWIRSCFTPHGNGLRLARSLRVDQRIHETRPAAVRALVLYPMNALVEDQLSRLRRALDWKPLALGSATSATATPSTSADTTVRRRFRGRSSRPARAGPDQIATRWRPWLNASGRPRLQRERPPSTRLTPVATTWRTSFHALTALRCGLAGTCRSRRRTS